MAHVVDDRLVAPQRLVRPRPSEPSARIDLPGLEAELRKTVAGEVRFDRASRGLYALDASNYFEEPLGVVIPRSIDDVVATVAACRRFAAPIVSRGGGTSLAGQTCNYAVVIDFSKYLTRILEIDPRQRAARVQPGVICDQLNDAVSAYRLAWGPEPATHDHCCFGGMIANNCGGTHAQMSGTASANVEDMNVLLYDGTRMHVGWMTEADIQREIARGGRTGGIYRELVALREQYTAEIRRRYPDIPRRVSGYNLDQLIPNADGRINLARALVGSEGTLVTMLDAKLRLVDKRAERVLVVLAFEDIFQAADTVPRFLRFNPTALEGIDHELHVDISIKGGLHAKSMEMLPEGRAWLLVELGADDRADAINEAERVIEEARKNTPATAMKLIIDPAEQKEIWRVREAGLGVTAFIRGRPDAWPGWEDSAVDPSVLGNYLRELTALFRRFDYRAAVYGHFGMGCVHCRIPFDLTSTDGIAKYRAFLDEATALVDKFGGSFSGEHGSGQARAELLERMFGPKIIEAFRWFKRIWDPDGKMNPGKLVDPRPLDADLRLGPDYSPQKVETHFRYPDDHGSFAHATLRCVGIGQCRRLDGTGDNQTMCPSFMVTRDEKHTTRGRAHLLWEMVARGPVEHDWQSEEVKGALDLCLACKGCKGDCPVNVDIATQKAEFLSHYYEKKQRPRQAYAFGFIDQWARLASIMPGLANLVTQVRGVSALAKLVANVPREREIPPLSPQTFQRWFEERGRSKKGAPKVVLFPDTFNNHFFPRTAKAAVRVLEHAGFDVVVPDGHVCCGRPLYDFGFLDIAKRYAEDVIERLRPHVEAGQRIVVLEPSCATVFRDEMRNLWPDREDVQKLGASVMVLSEFLEHVSYTPPRLDREAILQGHCHQKALFGMADERRLLQEMGMRAKELDSGCCGMAGAFGYERGDKYAVSIACGERVLLPAVRHAKPSTFVVADGFSCRSQISQETERHALHAAEVMALALSGGREGPNGAAPPERAIVETHRREIRRSMARTIAALGGLFALALLAVLQRQRRRGGRCRSSRHGTCSKNRGGAS